MDMSKIPKNIYKKAKKDLDSVEGYDKWSEQYTHEWKMYRVRKISEAEAIARYLVQYVWKRITEEWIQIVWEEWSVDTRTNFTKLIEYGMIWEGDTDIFFISDRRHEPAVMWKFHELFSSSWTQPNRTRANPDGKVHITSEMKDSLNTSFRWFLSIEWIFSRYPTRFWWESPKKLKDIHEFSPDGIWAYGNNLEARKKLWDRIINSTYANLVPTVQNAVNNVWKTRPITYGWSFQYIFWDWKWNKNPYNHR